jgi:hypothetical protein
MRVHSETWQFKIFADGNPDTRRIDSLISNANEMVYRAGSRRASDVNLHGKWDVILWPAGSCSHWRERIKELSSNEFLRRRCTTQLRLVEVRSLESA